MSSGPHTSDRTNTGSFHASVRFEPRDINPRVILFSLLSIAAVLIASVIVLWPIYGYLNRPNLPVSFPTSPLVTGEAPVEPRKPPLQGTPGQKLPLPEELKQMQAKAEAQLTSYGWVDRQAGIARIPIEESMKILAAGGRLQTDTANGSDASPGR